MNKLLTSYVHSFWPVAGQHLPMPEPHHPVPTVAAGGLCVWAGRDSGSSAHADQQPQSSVWTQQLRPRVSGLPLLLPAAPHWQSWDRVRGLKTHLSLCLLLLTLTVSSQPLTILRQGKRAQDSPFSLSLTPSTYCLQPATDDPETG